MASPSSALPVIVDPFGRFGDEIAGDAPSQIALNLAAATRIALSFRCKPLRPCGNPWAHFQAVKADLSPEAVDAVAFTARVYQKFANRLQKPGGREIGTPRRDATSGEPDPLAGSSPALSTQTLF